MNQKDISQMFNFAFMLLLLGFAGFYAPIFHCVFLIVFITEYSKQKINFINYFHCSQYLSHLGCFKQKFEKAITWYDIDGKKEV